MCFAPQRRALVRHRMAVLTCSVFNMFASTCASPHSRVQFFDISTSKSGPNLKCFVHVLLEMCFAYSGVHFFDISTSKVVRRWGVLYIFMSQCTSESLEKKQCFATSLPFPACIFSLLTFSISDVLHLWSSPFWLSPRPSLFLAVLFHLSILSGV